MLKIEQIDELLSAYAELLVKVRQEKPNLVEVTALASILHSFYHGLESIFTFVAKDIDRHVPSGAQSHRELLDQIRQPNAHRHSVLSPDLVQKLQAYLSFRHFYRHSYSYFINWSKFAPLIHDMPDIWLQVKTELALFLDQLNKG